MHVYDRHYDMIKKIVSDGEQTYRRHMIPEPTRDEVVALIQSKGKEGSGAYCDWLRAA
jgi:hypothetical protein